MSEMQGEAVDEVEDGALLRVELDGGHLEGGGG